MPIKQSMTSKSQLLKQFALLLLAFTFFAVSCKSDKKSSNPADLFDGPNTINFTINGEQIVGGDQINKDLTMLDYQEDRTNKDHVLHIPINDSIYFKDISQFKDGAPDGRQWYVDEQPLSQSGKEVAFYSEEVGPAIITLKYDDYNYVMKGVFFTDAFDMSDDFAEATNDDMEDMTQVDNSSASSNNDEDYSAIKSTEKPMVQSTPSSSSKTSNNSSSSSSQTKSTVSTPPPPPVKREITKVDFSVSKLSVETGEKVVFRDLSEPAIAVENRVWDWGDGNTMPTRGSTAGYSFYKPGTYNVKLCLNYSSNCTTKTITVTKAKEAIVAAPVPVKEEKKPEVKEVKVSQVVISAASKTQVGKPIEFKDESFPAEAVKSREWYINGEKSNVSFSKFSKAFENPGNYTIKLCVNGDNSMCTSKVINVEEKPKPTPVPVTASSSSTESTDEFFAVASSRTGLRNSQRCPETEVSWHNAVSEMVLSPTVRLELMNARIFGKKVAYAKATLKSSDGSINKTINNVQILPGPSTIEFGDFGIILQPGKKYTLIVEPMPGQEMELENGGNCNKNFAADDRLGVSYKDNIMVLYDIKFGY